MKLCMITDQGDIFKIILTKMAGRIFYWRTNLNKSHIEQSASKG